ncbi:MAG: CRISPR-associated primase-polymerase type A1 [Proteobacteria bacterium]|nr:CRISPR-associated primase-polymerase type A1 [Pseudomonadota bacterium]
MSDRISANHNINALLARARDAESQGNLEAAVTAYNQALNIDDTHEGALVALSELRRDMGMFADAERLLRHLQKHRPNTGTRHLAELFAHMGDAAKLSALQSLSSNDDRTREAIAALLQNEHAISDARDTEDDTSPPSFQDSDLLLMADLFSGREGVHARQWSAPDGRTGYSPIQQPLNGHIIRQHLMGTATIGAYVIRRDNQVSFMAVDIDVSTTGMSDITNRQKHLENAKQLTLHMAELARRSGLAPLIEWSGYKGYHLWCFFDEPWPAHKARTLLKHIQQSAGALPAEVHIDLFPAQSHVKKGGLGNLIKLPLGLHLKSGLRSRLLHADGTHEAHPMSMLRDVQRTTQEQLDDLHARIKTNPSLSNDDDKGSASKTSNNPRSTEDSDDPVHFSRAQLFSGDDYRIEDDAELAWIRSQCTVLHHLIESCESGDLLHQNEITVLTYTLGHLTHGPRIVNTLLARAGITGIPPLRNRLRGHPTSCAKIRHRLGIEPITVGCLCHFDPSLGAYAHPLLHISALRYREMAEQVGYAALDNNADAAQLLRMEEEIARLSKMSNALKLKLVRENLANATADKPALDSQAPAPQDETPEA